MTKNWLFITPAMLMAGAAFAQATMGDIDDDGDGMASFDELTAFYSALSEDVFAEADSDGDGLLDESELAAAQEAGLLVEDA